MSRDITGQNVEVHMASVWLSCVVVLAFLAGVHAASWNYVLTAPDSYRARRGHSSLLVDDELLVTFGGRSTFFEDQSSVPGQVNINLPPSLVNSSTVYNGPNAPEFVCKYGCWGNGLCTIPGIASAMSSWPASVQAAATALINTYGLTTDDWIAASTAMQIDPARSSDTVNDVMLRACGSACALASDKCKNCGTCVCDESYSGEFCNILEKDIFLDQISYFNFSSYKWWSRVPKTGVNNIIIETWPGVRSHHSAVILQAAIPYNLPVDNPNGTMVWENSSISATNHFVTNGWTMYNRTQYTGPYHSMMVLYGGVSPSCGDYCYDVWIWDFNTQVWFSDFSFASGLLNGVADETKGPLNRWNAASLEYNNRMIIVHGHRMHRFLSDIWSFEAEYMKWTQIIPQIDAFPRKGISSSCQCYTNPDASYPFLAGSCFGSGTLNRPQMSPIQVGPFYRPSARMGAAVVKYKDGFYMFGGFSDSNNCPLRYDTPSDPTKATCTITPFPDYIQDLWYFNFTQSSWSCRAPTTTSVMPVKRQGATLLLVDDFLLFLYGGYTNNQYFSDVWRYNISSGFWTMQVIFRGQNEIPAPRSFHSMHYWKPFNGFFVFGGYGSNSTGFQTYFETDYKDMWYYNVSECPNACNGRGTCTYGFCYCDDQYFGPDCQEVQCPDDYCVYDLVTQVQSCQHCYGQGNCMNGVCRCFDNFDGDSCGVLLCPNDCWQHGVCILEAGATIPSCLCNAPYGGIDCELPVCPGNCSNRGKCTVEGLDAYCTCDKGFAGEDCSLVNYQA